jgi:hypothetical protein
MTLQEKFFNWYPKQDAEFIAEECEKIADDFAIGFALWKEGQVSQDDNGLYYGESRIAVSRKNPVSIYRLLEIYKKQKGLCRIQL